MEEFKVVSEFSPAGDQPKAIEELSEGVLKGMRAQTLLGVTGSGKTFAMAKVIESVKKPTLILAHNKTLAAQLYNEFKSFFPYSAVEFFVSYYDYYQPEAYVPGRDLYIEKDSSINDDIDKLRHSATCALAERRDVIIVSSVSCIYGLGNPIDYKSMVLSLRPGMVKSREDIMRTLINIQYARNEMDFKRGTFRVKGDVIEIYPASSDGVALRVELYGDEVDRLSEINSVTGKVLTTRNHISVYPATHYVAGEETLERALVTIQAEMNERVKQFNEQGKLVEAQRIAQRTNYDMEMLREMGYCKGIENYTRHLNATPPGAPPYTLLDYFPEDYMMFVDESHVTLPQVRGMFGGDKSRKENLVEYGFRLPSTYDNRPLNFSEFEGKINQVVFVSATPGDYERDHSSQTAELIVRPTGLIDPKVEIVPSKGQIDHLIGQINKETAKGNRILVTTLTKRMAEDLTAYLSRSGIACQYLHSDIDTVERMKIINDLRSGVFDVLVGINLLREGLDMPEVSLVAILDADKEGFLRSETSLIQTIGRAARHVEGHVIMYADTITDSMARALEETDRRRSKQQQYNEQHNITPRGITKKISGGIQEAIASKDIQDSRHKKEKTLPKQAAAKEVNSLLASLEADMKEASAKLDFERAMILRDRIKTIKSQLGGGREE
ncbi:MAG: excinuclease ABC subunit UvrB [Eubacteriaceae bacterium]|nr:excinuclease ABC subunit UvrB [Eubacteriaceae bacterium]